MPRYLDEGVYPTAAVPVSKYGCVFTPTRFSTIFSAILTDAFRSSNTVVRMKYRMKRYSSSTCKNFRQSQQQQQQQQEKSPWSIDCFTRFLFASWWFRSPHRLGVWNEVDCRNYAVSGQFQQTVRNSVWELRGTSYTTRLKVYLVVVLSILPYVRAWTVQGKHASKHSHNALIP